MTARRAALRRLRATMLIVGPWSASGQRPAKMPARRTTLVCFLALPLYRSTTATLDMPAWRSERPRQGETGGDPTTQDSYCLGTAGRECDECGHVSRDR